jgi:hypothetical protein
VYAEGIMENVHGLLTALVCLVALLGVLRWIFGGARRYSAPRRSHAAGATAAWSHVEERRRDLASSGSWPIGTR